MLKRLQWMPVLPVVMLAVFGCHDGRTEPPMPNRVVDLSPALTVDYNTLHLGSRVLRFLGTDGRVLAKPIIPKNKQSAFGLTLLTLPSHTGAHLDAPARLLRGGEPPSLVNLSRMIGRAKVADLRWHDHETEIEIGDLELTPIVEGDVVILFVGYESPAPGEWPHYAAVSTQLSEWLVAKRIRALATDMPTIGSYRKIGERLRAGQPAEAAWAEYVPLFQAQIPVIGGLVNIEKILKEPNVLFVGLPLSLADGTGAPMRAAAFVY